MSFLVPGFLLALPLASIPLLLHLFNKPRYKREPWGAMLFLEDALQTRSRSIQLQEWILMAMRCLALLLLILAMSRPVFRGEQAGQDQRPTTHVLILDASYSMQRIGDEGSLFDAAREAALEMVEDMRPQDNMLIIRAGAKPEALFPRPVFDKAFLRGRLEQLEAGPEASDLPAALEQAAWLLGFSTLPSQRIVVLDDGQRAAWQEDAEESWTRVTRQLEELPNPPALYSIGFAAEEEGNYLAITGLRTRTPLPDRFRPVEFDVEIRNDGEEALTRSIRFSVNGRRRDVRELTLEPGPNALSFTHRFREAGSHQVEVDLGGDDLPIDNRATLALEVLEQLPVLILEGQEQEKLLESDGGLLALALEAGRTLDGSALFAVDRMTQFESEELKLKDFMKYRCVVLANVPALSSRLGGLMEQYLKAGGGVLIGMGPEQSVGSYNRWTRDAGGWLPVELGDWVSLEEAPVVPTFPAGRAAEILDVFDLSRTRQLEEVQVRGYRKLTPQGEGIEVGQFDEDLFLWVSQVEEGHCGIWSSSFNPQESTFPVIPDFVPLVQNIILRLAGGALPPVNLQQGETLVVPLDLETLPADAEFATVTTPDAQENKVALEAFRRSGVLEWNVTQQPGLYQVAVPGQPPRFASVALPEGEGLLQALDEDQQASLQETANLQICDSLEALRRLMEQESGVRDLWRMLLLFCLALLSLEALLAWRFSQ